MDLAIVGPSASGKTALAARIADLCPDVALVSVDALAVYRKMDVGTAKPTRPADPASRHPWHLVDLADPAEEYSVARFQRAFARAREEIHATGRHAVLVGGTGLYHRAVVDGLELPGRYPAVAARLEREAASGRSSEALHARLRELDPVAAGRMEPSNLRRVIRALEVTEGSGRRFSEFGPGLRTYPEIDTLVVGLRLDRAVLASRLEQRLVAQMEEGFLDEVRALAVAPGGLSRTARQAIGYAELLGHLEGRWSLEEALERAVRRLRSFARRQEAWFRRDPRVEWFEADDPSLVDRVIERWETARP
ncbi:MAG TPA: tRNA (adenosine(37)-N6)-dimethylallyltransferase MiaA [Acidimicrobiales bacterium]|nr:tRNA (adenosine(37)-N6)-dimethylallyltransferase MiaA [Acidimicrobiales bacterium]